MVSVSSEATNKPPADQLICEWQHLELPAIAVEDSILVCTENLDANVVMMKSAQDRV